MGGDAMDLSTDASRLRDGSASSFDDAAAAGSRWSAVTTAADGLLRRRFTVAEVERMNEAGFLQDERFELIGGEFVPMSPKGYRHELLKTALNEAWVSKAPRSLRFTPETTFRLTSDTFLEPDFVVYPRAIGLKALSPDAALLVVEISDTSLGYDLGRKAKIYAGFGVRELWVIDAVRLVAHVHREPTPEGYAFVQRFEPHERIEPGVAPALGLVLKDLELE